MRLSNFFNALTPSFLSPKKSKNEDAQLRRSDNKNASSRQARANSQVGPAPGDEEAIVRLTSRLASERQRAIASRERTEKQLQRLLPVAPNHKPDPAQMQAARQIKRLERALPVAPTHKPDPAQMQIARQIKWLEQALPVAPTHLPSLSEPSKKPAAPRQLPGVAKPSVSRISKGTIKKLIAIKRQKLDSFVKVREAMRKELDALMSANKRKGQSLLPTERLVLQQKAQALTKMEPAGRKLLAEIHVLEKKLRFA